MPSLAPANSKRGVANISPLFKPKHEIVAANKRIVAPTGPTICSATAASGASFTAEI